MIGASRASSESRKARVSAGERQMAVAAWSKNLALRSSLSSAFFDNSDSRATISGGSFAGPVNVVHELMSKPGRVSAMAGTSGTTLHLSGELFKIMAKVDMVHVPYRGAAPAMQDLLAGQINMIFDNIPGALAQARPGKVRALGVTSEKRSPIVPDVPAIAETLPGFDINSWTTLTGPAKLPPEIVARLSELSKKALESEDLKAKFLDQAATAIWRSPADTLAFRDSEEARLAPIIKASGARVD